MGKSRSVAVSSVLVMLAACANGGGTTRDADPIARLWRLMDQRERSPELFAALRDERSEVRKAAIVAISRVHHDGGDGAAEALLERLGDTDAEVRRAALFALGQMRRGGLVVGMLDDPDAESRELAIHAIGKCGEAGFATKLLPALADRVRRVRGAAALAVQRLLGDRLRLSGPPASPELHAAVVAALIAATDRERDDEVRWHFVYALAHLADPSAEPTLLRALANGTREDRVFAARGLSALPPTDAIRAGLLAALADPRPAVVIEAATALASPERQSDPEVRKREGTLHPEVVVSGVLVPLSTEHPVVAVRAVALRLMGRCGASARFPPLPSDPTLAAAWIDGQARVRRATPGAPKLAPEAEELDKLDWRVRAAYARNVGSDMAGAQRFLDDPDLRVRAALLEALPRAFPGKQATPLVRRALGTRDLFLRETIGELAPVLKDPALAPALVAAIADSPGSEFAESRKLLMQATVTLDPTSPATRDLLTRSLRDPDLVVRRAARALLKGLGTEVPPAADDRQRDLVTPELGTDVPLAFLETRPEIVFETTRGRLRLVLRPDLAPVHCQNLVRLVASGAYDGRIVHRVVPNFVVQGGDRRGDGSGARSWLGGFLRDEINPLLFETGTVGMPKTADPDTGGDQFFVTTVPTPHLDGRYTAFGVVTEGLELLDAFAIGDRIVRAFVLEP